MDPDDRADLGLGYPPNDDTEDLVDVSDMLSLTSNSKKPSTTSTAKHLVEGIQINNHKEADHL